MNPDEAAGYIQHIAALGIAPLVSIPIMVKAIEDVVPSRCNPFAWAGSDGMVADLYIEEILPSAMENSIRLSRFNTPEHIPTFDRVINGPLPFDNISRMKRLSGYASSALRNEMLRGYDAENMMDFALRDMTGLRGTLAILRGARERELQPREVRRVRRLLPHFVHAMNASADSPVPTESDVSEGIGYIIASRRGEIAGFAGHGRELALQLHNLPIDQTVDISKRLHHLPHAAMLVVDRLNAARMGQPGLPAMLEVPVRSGLLRISAHPVEATHGNRDDMAMVSIVPLIDRKIRRARHLAGTRLSLAERRVAMRMAELGTGEEVARDLGMGIGTYRQHAKRIYATLGVDGRLGVKAMLDS